MLSRVADAIFWMSRYIERAENIARFIDVNLLMMLDMPAGLNEQWMPLVDTTGENKDFVKRYGEGTRENVIEFLTFDRKNPNSIYSCLRAARENARSVREIIPSEMWEQVNRFYLTVHSRDSQERALEDPHNFFTEVKINSHLFEGINNATMSHGEPWHFTRLGRMLERADKTSRLVDVKYYILLPSVTDIGTPFEDIQWSAVLKSTSALEMYRQKHGRISPHPVVDFLVLDRHFPRAIHYCLARAEESLHAISGTPIGSFGNIAERRLGQLRSELAYARVEEIITGGLHEFLDNLQTKVNLVGDAIYATFLTLRKVGKNSEVAEGILK